jgi:hypothetical protein
MRNECKILVSKSQGKAQVVISRCGLKDDIRMDLKNGVQIVD